MNLTRKQMELLEIFDLELKEGEAHLPTRRFQCPGFFWKEIVGLTKKGFLKLVSSRDRLGECEVTLTWKAIEYLEALEQKGHLEIQKKLERKTDD